MKRLRLAMIGLGPAAQPHSQALKELSERVELVAAASRSAARAEKHKAAYGFPVTTDIDGVIADPSIDAALLLTPPAAHLDLAEKLFAAGKHVLVEKPLELTAARGKRLVAAGRAAKRRLGVVLQHRFRPSSVRLRALLADGSLGAVEAASASVPWWRPQSYYDEPGRGTMARDGGGVLLTQAIHSLDLFRSLVGVSCVVAAQAVTTNIHRMETEDWAGALIRLGDGAPGAIVATTASYPGAPERIEIICRNAMATIHGGDLRVAWHDGREEVLKSDARTGAGANIMDFSPEAHRALIVDFLDAVEQDRDPLVSGEEALASQTMIEDILAAARSSSRT